MHLAVVIEHKWHLAQINPMRFKSQILGDSCEERIRLSKGLKLKGHCLASPRDIPRRRPGLDLSQHKGNQN